MESLSYPGFQLTYSDLQASEYAMYFAAKPDYSQYDWLDDKAIEYYDNATVVVSATSLNGGKAGFWSDKTGNYGVNFNDCIFEGWSQAAIRLLSGSLTVSNSTFKTSKTPLSLTEEVDGVILAGNRFASSQIVSGNGWSDSDARIRRDDANSSIPHTPEYDYTYVSDVKPAGDAIFNVVDYGAVIGSIQRIPNQD